MIEMKKTIIVTIFCILLLGIMPNTFVLASSNQYEIPELGLEVTVPSEYIVLTRDMSDEDPVFEKIGVTREVILKEFQASAIYLDAIVATGEDEIVVIMVPNDINNMSLFGETALLT